MADREKLIELLKQAPFEGKVLDEWWWEEKIARIADYLIANGVDIPVRCKNCTYYNDDGEYCGMWGECRHPEHYCEEGILCGQLPVAPNSATDNNVGGKWIPVTERLPENAEKVLALSKSIFVGNYLSWLVRYNPKKGAWYDYDSEWGDIKIHNVTHWMPLPEPPKED